MRKASLPSWETVFLSQDFVAISVLPDGGDGCGDWDAAAPMP